MSWNAKIIELISLHAEGDKEAYQKFFKSALSKFGIKSPAELDDEKKKEFFNYIDKNYDAKNESVIKENPAVIATAARISIQNKQGKDVSVNYARKPEYAKVDKSAHKKAKSIFDKIKDKLKKAKGKKSSSSSKGQKLKTTNDPKMGKSDAQKYSDLYGGGAKVESTASYAASLEKIARDRQLRQISNKDKQLLMKLAKMMKNANESVNEASTNWEWSDSRIAAEINKIMRLAGIKVIEHRPFKKPYRSGDSELYGAFITVKDQHGDKTVLPIEVNNKGIVTYAGGPKGWHKMEKIGALNMSHADSRRYLTFKGVGQPVAFLKHFKKMPGFGQDVIKRK